MKKIIVLFLSLCFWTSVMAQVSVNIPAMTNVTCFGICNGTATAVASGGTAPYTYSWSNLNTAPYETGLCAGTYSVTVTDNLGLTATASITINQPTQLQASYISTNSCGGVCNGSATVTVIGGTPGYTYYWPTGQTTTDVSNLCPGTYAVTITDSNGCTVIQNVNIGNNPGTITDITIDSDPVFCENNLGFATVSSVTGGTAPYTYYWSGGGITGTGQTFNNLFAGTYCVTVADASGCGYSECVTIEDSLGFNILLDSISPANCANNQLGYIGISISGGLGPFAISWSNGINNTTYIDSLEQDIYTVTVLDSSSGCFLHQTDTIYSTYNLYASIVTQGANCSANGSAAVTVQGVNPPFNYLWNDSLSQTDSVASGLVGGNYSVTITDTNGCTVVAHATIGDNCVSMISGRIYNDTDQDCVQDSGEVGLSNIIVRSMQAGNYVITDQNGDYTMTTLLNSNTLYISNLYNGYQYICPSLNDLDVNLTALGDTSTGNNFAVYQAPGAFDLTIHPGWTPGHPGFQKRYWVYYGLNYGTPQNASINFIYDPILQYDSCTNGGVHDAINHTITWNYTNVSWSPWDWYIRPNIYFTVPTSASIYDTLDTYFEILPFAGDADTLNNTLYVSERITGSHDPNDKQVYPRGEGLNGCILPEDSVLFYTIRFQNDGNDTAFTIVVVDTLSPYVNPATFVAGAASHPYTVSMTGEGILTFRFDQIMLPDSTTDKEGSQGSINFTVNTDSGLPWNTVIANRASIFFDFNEAVVTNTVINTLCEPTSIPVPENKLGVSVFPNPAKSSATFAVSGNESARTIRILDICGKEILNRNVSGNKEFNLILPENMNGVYLYEIRSENRIAYGKFLVE